MAIICPTVTAYDSVMFHTQMQQVASFAERVHIDLMDGDFAPTTSPGLGDLWIPHGLTFDIHLMYRHPMDFIDQLIKIHPNMVIIHAEADVYHALFAAEMHKADIKAGIALLADTTVGSCEEKISGFDHALLFSGHLGYHGGHADLGLLHKIEEIKSHHPNIEFGWDGGISDENIQWLTSQGVNVLNVGGYIQNSPDPTSAYSKLTDLLKQN